MAISEKLQALVTARQTLASNLRGVGVAASDTETLTQLAAKVADADTWHPNPYWPSLDDTLDNEIAFVVQDRDDTGVAARFAFIVTTSTGSYSINWGDGVTESLASGATADHTYAIGGGTSDGHGKTTYKAKITAVGNITQFLNQPVRGSVYIPSTMLYCVYKATRTITLSNSFYRCSALQMVIFTTLPLCTGMQYTFMLCSSLVSIDFPSLPSCTNIGYTFYYASSLRAASFAALPICTSFLAVFAYCSNLRAVTLPSLPEVTSLGSSFTLCYSLESISITGAQKCTTINSIFGTNFKLRSVTIDPEIGLLALSVDGMGAFGIVPASFDGYFPNAKFTKFGAAGLSGMVRSGLKSLTFHPSSTFSGTAPQIDISYCDFTRQSLVNLFNILPTLTGKQVKITGCTGAAELTAGDRAIATGKGWTIIE